MPETPDSPDAAQPAETRAAERLRMLRELAEIGMAHARALGRRLEDEAAAEGDDTALRDAGLAFPRIARAVRQTLALEARLEGEFAEGVRKAADAAAFRIREAERNRIGARTDVVRRSVREALHTVATAGEFDDYLEDLDDRLSEREEDPRYLDRPIGELVAMICKDLGIACDARLWEDQDWFKQEAAARRAPESPGTSEPGDSDPPFSGHALNCHPPSCHPGMGEAHVRDP